MNGQPIKHIVDLELHGDKKCLERSSHRISIAMLTGSNKVRGINFERFRNSLDVSDAKVASFALNA